VTETKRSDVMTAQNSYKLAVIGGGMMGAALVRGFVGQGILEPAEIIVSDVDASRRQALTTELGVAVTDDNAAAVAQSEAVLVAIKPQVAAAVLPSLRDAVSDGQLVISIMAGVTIGRLRELLGDAPALVRVMPNIPATVQTAASAYAVDAKVTDQQAAEVQRLLEAVGVALPVEERLMDAVTGLSGSGPAFLAVFIEALADGGVAAGLPRKAALELATQTVMGAAKLCQELDSPALLKDMVASPGGTTIAGLSALEAGGLRSAVIEAVLAAARRSEELGK